MSLGAQGTPAKAQGASAGLNFYPLESYVFLIKAFLKKNIFLN